MTASLCKLVRLLLHHRDMQNHHEGEITMLTSDVETERRDVFKWLSRTQHANHHKAMGKDFLPDSGNWLLQRKEFVEWRTESSSSILWLHGIRQCSLVA